MVLNFHRPIRSGPALLREELHLRVDRLGTVADSERQAIGHVEHIQRAERTDRERALAGYLALADLAPAGGEFVHLDQSVLEVAAVRDRVAIEIVAEATACAVDAGLVLGEGIRIVTDRAVGFHVIARAEGIRAGARFAGIAPGVGRCAAFGSGGDERIGGAGDDESVAGFGDVTDARDATADGPGGVQAVGGARGIDAAAELDGVA